LGDNVTDQQTTCAIDEGNVDQAREALRECDESHDRYIAGILDFFKWTTTFAFAAVVWIGSNFQNANKNTMLYPSVIIILFSIVIAIVSTRAILKYWESDWIGRQLDVKADILSKKVTSSGGLYYNQLEELNYRRYYNIKDIYKIYKVDFDRNLILHISTLFIGIAIYLFGAYNTYAP